MTDAYYMQHPCCHSLAGRIVFSDGSQVTLPMGMYFHCAFCNAVWSSAILSPLQHVEDPERPRTWPAKWLRKLPPLDESKDVERVRELERER